MVSVQRSTLRRTKPYQFVCSTSGSNHDGTNEIEMSSEDSLQNQWSDLKDAIEKERLEGMKEYEELKKLLLKRTWRFGTLFAGYLLLTVSTEAAFAELVGAAASYGYLLWLMKYIDEIGPNSSIPPRDIESIQPSVLRWITKLGYAYRSSLNPRLLVPITLVLLTGLWNQKFADDYHLGIVEQGCLIGGFLSYKIALILKLYDDLKPRALTEEEMLQASRPQLVQIDDVDFDLGKRRNKSEQIEEGKPNNN